MFNTYESVVNNNRYVNKKKKLFLISNKKNFSNVFAIYLQK